jgi:flavin-binding protein dodecin
MVEEECYTGTSFESFEDATRQAFQQVPAGPEGLKRARIVEQALEEGGIVGRTQYKVTVAVSSAGKGGSG